MVATVIERIVVMAESMIYCVCWSTLQLLKLITTKSGSFM